MFLYKNLKSIIYIFLAIAAICGTAFQFSNFYHEKQKLVIEEEVGYLITNGDQVLIKKNNSQVATLAMHGQRLVAGDNIRTLATSVDFEAKDKKLRFRILPQSDVVVKMNGQRLEFYASAGSIQSLGKADTAKASLFVQNANAQFVQSVMPAVENFDAGSLLQVQKIEIGPGANGQELHFSWNAKDAGLNRWLEFRVGTDSENLQTLKTYAFESGEFSEPWSAGHFYWQAVIKENDTVIETTPVKFWKNEFASKINLIYPAENEVINNVTSPDDFVFKWSKAANVDKVKVQVFLNGQKISEIDAGRKNQVSYKPARYGFYYWRVLSTDSSVVSENRGFHFSPLADSETEVLDWHTSTEASQFYYADPILHLKWQKKLRMPVQKYKVTLIYFQNDSKESLVSQKENFLVGEQELNVKLDTVSPVKVKIQAYNGKMQPIGKTLEKEVKLVTRLPKQMLSFATHTTTKKKEIITDRNYSLNFDTDSISAIYQYPYEVQTTDGKIARKGVLYKGDRLYLKGLATDYYQVNFKIQSRKLVNYFESQNLGAQRLPASVGVSLQQSLRVKLVPPIDYNVTPSDRSQIITPQVDNVEIKN